MLQFRPLAKALPPNWQMTGLLYPVFAGGPNNCTSITELAARMRAPLDACDGPIVIVGYSIGGTFAYQIATELRARGKEVAVVCIDTRLRTLLRKRGRLARGFRNLLYRKPRRLLNRLRAWHRPAPPPLPDWSPDDPDLKTFVTGCRESVRRYHPARSDVPVVMIRAQAHRDWRHWIDDKYWPSPTHGWSRVAPVAGIIPGPGDHLSIINPEHVDALAKSLDQALALALACLAAPQQGRRRYKRRRFWTSVRAEPPA